jgi:hypothetical protein
VQCKLVPSLYYALNRLIYPQTLEWLKVLDRELFVDGEFAVEKNEIHVTLYKDLYQHLFIIGEHLIDLER